MCAKLLFLVNLFVGESSLLKFSKFTWIIICWFLFIFFHFQSFLFSNSWLSSLCPMLFTNECCQYSWQNASVPDPSCLSGVYLISTLIMSISTFFSCFGVIFETCPSSSRICFSVTLILFCPASAGANTLCTGQLLHPIPPVTSWQLYSGTSSFTSGFTVNFYSTSLKV